MLNVLSAGAAKAVVNGVAKEAGVDVGGAFGAVGVIKDMLMADEPCDVIVLTQEMIDALVVSRHVLKKGVGLLGWVKTGVAVKSGVALPGIAHAAGLRSAFVASDSIYVPDLRRSTAGRHIASVLESLGIATEVGPRIREFPNGAAAMRAMGDAHGSRAIGCTQVSEILYTPGVTLVGPLPVEFELATAYAAGVCAKAIDAAAAKKFVSLLTGDASSGLRLKAGFEALR
jgi:molybdate transport system substrate-binding protein